MISFASLNCRTVLTIVLELTKIVGDIATYPIIEPITGNAPLERSGKDCQVRWMQQELIFFLSPRGQQK